MERRGGLVVASQGREKGSRGTDQASLGRRLPPSTYETGLADQRSCQSTRPLVDHVEPVAPDDLGVPLGAHLGCALEAREVDVHQAELLRVAVRPLEVVQQRPNKVAAHVGVVLQDGLVDLGEVALEEDRARGVLGRVVDRVLAQRDAVLGDEDATLRVELGLRLDWGEGLF